MKDKYYHQPTSNTEPKLPKSTKNTKKEEVEMLKVPSYDQLEYAVVYNEISGHMTSLQNLPAKKGMLRLLETILSQDQFDELILMDEQAQEEYLERCLVKLSKGHRKSLFELNMKYALTAFFTCSVVIFVLTLIAKGLGL